MHWEDARHEAHKAMKTSITEYRVFTLPRFPVDPKDGFIRLAVGDGMRPIQFREEIDEYLEKWADSIDRRIVTRYRGELTGGNPWFLMITASGTLSTT